MNWWDNSGNEELKRSSVILIRNILLVDPKVGVSFVVLDSVVDIGMLIEK